MANTREGWISGFGSRMEHILLLMGIIVVSSLIIAGRIK